MIDREPSPAGTPDPNALRRREFMGWQCRIRQLCIRHAGGRPTSGMRPALRLPDGGARLGHITVLIVKREPEAITAQFEHMVRRTHDPAERYQSAVELLAAAYYHKPEEFSDRMTALFGPDSPTVRALLAHRRCTLEFEQYQRGYRIDFQVEALSTHDPAFRCTFWHNSLFNPELPAGVCVLGFQPRWESMRVSSSPSPG